MLGTATSVAVQNFALNVTYSCTLSAAPSISIAAPLDSTTIALPALVPVTFNVSVAVGKTISKIELYNQTNLLWGGSTTTFNWQPLAAGSYSLIAKVTDSDGNVGLSAPINVSLTGAASETITYLHNDLGGNTIMASDSLGGTLWKENYTPFGDRVVKDAQATSNNRQWFAGKPQDSETGLSYFGARYYDPAVGRFMGIDAARFSEGNLHSFNRYAYGNNNPLKYRDPNGNFALAEILIIGGLGVTIGLSLAPQDDRDRLAQSLAGAISGIRDKVKGIFTEQDSSSGADNGKKDTLKPGDHAGESVPARGSGRDFTKEERDQINGIGQETGCHTCGSKVPGTKNDNFVPDHQPPNALNPSGEAQQLYPHCLTCSRVQGGQVRGQQVKDQQVKSGD